MGYVRTIISRPINLNYNDYTESEQDCSVLVKGIEKLSNLGQSQLLKYNKLYLNIIMLFTT